MKKLLSLLAVAFTFAILVPIAYAEELAPTPITTWGYSVQGIFTEWKDTNNRTGNVTSNNSNVNRGYTLNANGQRGDRLSTTATSLTYAYLGGEINPGAQQGYTSLRWGDRDRNYSSIGMTGATGTVVTDNKNWASAKGVSLWHDNRSINTSAHTLVSGTALLSLSLTAGGANGVVLPTYATALDFYFIETDNSTSHPSDIFIVKDPFEAANEYFKFNDINYGFSFGASFEKLTGEALRLAQDALGEPSDTVLYGWVTSENAMTTFDTYLTIHYETPLPPNPPQPTPEPASMALLALGLGGLAVAARRRRG